MVRHLIFGVYILHQELHALHGDIKLANVLIDLTKTPMVVRISDFGLLAEITVNPSDPSNEFVVMEWLQDDHRMPPEFSHYNPSTGKWEDNKKTDGRFSLDMWMLGCLLWQLITGDIREERPSGIKFFFTDKAVNDPTFLKSELDKQHQQPPDLRQTVLEMLSFDPSHRPSAFKAFLQVRDL